MERNSTDKFEKAAEVNSVKRKVMVIDGIRCFVLCLNRVPFVQIRSVVASVSNVETNSNVDGAP